MKVFPFIMIAFCLACSSPNGRELPVKTEQNGLQGKWKLVSSMQEPQTRQHQIPDSISYYKILTINTFIWYSYSNTEGKLLSSGGGKYRLEGEKYTEFLEFIYPHDAGIMSSSIPFRCRLKDNRWMHSGYIENREYDSQIGDYVTLSKYKLEEIWERVE